MLTDLQQRQIISLVILFSSVVSLVLGGLVLGDSPRRKVNRLFSVLCLALSAWGITFVGLNFCSSNNAILTWSRLYAAAVLFVPPLFFHLVIGSVGNPLKGLESTKPFLFDRLKQLAYVFSTGWLVLMTGGLSSPKIIEQPVFRFPDLGEQFWIAAALFAFLLLVATGTLFLQARSARDDTQRNRLYYMLGGSGAMIVAGVVGIALVYTVGATVVAGVAFSHLLAAVCLVLIAYSLTTSHLYHFSELLRKTLAFLVMTTILLSVFGGTHFLSSELLVPYIPRSDLFALGMASVIMALLFHPLRFRVQNAVDRLFFAKRYDQMQRLRGLSRRVLSSADREELLNVLFSSLHSIGFGSMSLMLKDPMRPVFQIRKSDGLSPNSEGFFLKMDSLLIQHVREEKGELIRDEVTRRILTDWERQSISEEMDILQAEICFPLFSTRRRALFGMITLGNSDLGYSSYKGRNIFWLKSVIDNAGVMLDNFYHQEFANALVPYVGKAWANEMRRNKEGFRERLAGHRVWVAVLMVDIRHFTPLSARLDPREVVSMLQEFRLRVAPVVYRHQGTIDKFIGDAILIVFGLPILPHLANTDLAAVQCAMEIMQEMEAMNAKRFETGRKDAIPVGIGVSSGEVIAGNVDSGDRVEYTVIGDAVNMVARLEDLAGDNQVLLSPATYQRVREHVSVKAWKPRFVSGFEEPIVVYELLGTEVETISETPFLPPTGTVAANQ